MAWLRDLEPDALALWAGREEFARAIRAAGFAGEISGYYGVTEERYIGSDNPTIVEIATASPEFRQFVADRQVQVYARDMGWMTADIYLLIDGQVQAQISDRPGDFDRVMGVVTDLAVPMILTAGLSAGVGALVQASGATGALATTITRAGASTLYAAGTGGTIDAERILTGALVAGGGELALDFLSQAGTIEDLTGGESMRFDGAADSDAGGILDPWNTDAIVTVTDAGIDFSDIAAAGAGGGVSLADVLDLGGDIVSIFDSGIDLSDIAAAGAGGGVSLADVVDLGTVADVVDLGLDTVAGGVSMGDDLSGDIYFDPNDFVTVDIFPDDLLDDAADIVETVDLDEVTDVFNPVDTLPDDPFAPPPILMPTAPPAPIPTVVIAPPAAPGITFDNIVKGATTAALAAISVVRAWEQRKLPVNPNARQTDPRGNQQTVTRDGVIVTRTPDGRTTTTRPAVGEPRMTVDGTMVMNNGDGTFTRVGADGRRETLPYPGAAGGGGVTMPGGVPPALLYAGGALVLLLALRR